MRTVRVLAHSFKGGASVFAQLPSQISSTSASQFATRVSRKGITALGSADVKMAAPAFVFQVFALRKSLSDFNASVGLAQQDAAWAITSGVLGLSGTTVELIGKVRKAVNPSASFKILGAEVASELVVRGGGLIGAGASVIDCFQSSIKAITMAKRGDMDAMGVHTGAAVFAAGAAWYGAQVALGTAALFGPVGMVIACVGAGLILAFAAPRFEDTAAEVWLDRCKFGNAERSEGPFKNRHHELDALELFNRDITVELEWRDTLLSPGSDEISLLVKRSAGRADGIIIGLFIEGSAGKRRVFVRQQGLPEKLPLHVGSLPHKFQKLPLAESSADTRFEARRFLRKGQVASVDEEGGKRIAWEETAKINTEKFDRAFVWLRYFPDISDLDSYFDDELAVADDS
jgi:hypothetical protein